MKKITLVCLVGLSVSSCTYQDVINYINGTDNNLTEEQKSEVDVQAQMGTTSTITIEDLENERDKNGGRPK